MRGRLCPHGNLCVLCKSQPSQENMRAEDLTAQAMAQMPQAAWGFMQPPGMGPMPIRYGGSYPGSPMRGMQSLGSPPLQRPYFGARPRAAAAQRPSPPASDDFARATLPLEAPSLGELPVLNLLQTLKIESCRQLGNCMSQVAPNGSSQS